MSLEQTPKEKAEQVQAELLPKELDDSQLKAVSGGSNNSTSDTVTPPFEGGNHQKPQQGH